MKNTNLLVVVLAALAAGGLSSFAQPDTNAPAATSALITTNITLAATNITLVTNAAPGAVTLPVGQPATSTNNIAEASDAMDLTPTNAVRMNFHDAPLNTVLNYLSKRMGFVVVSETDIRGTATIVSEQPVNTNEVIELLTGALAKNNYSVSQSGRVLTITTADAAKNGAETPVVEASSPSQIPVNDQIATYILPVHTLNPTQLIKDLDALIPAGATVAANEAGNAIVMTARQKDIHRFSEIINALDSSSVSTVEVFILNYADAKSVADELKEVFQSPDSSVARSDSRQRFRGMGFPGFGGPEGGSSSSGDSKNAANKAVFVSDDQMNAVIASAPADYFPLITNVVEQLDRPTQSLTAVTVFRLKYADAQETADELSNLFPDDSNNNNSSSQSGRSAGFRFFTPPWMQQPASAGASKSERMTRQATVRAVPDLRTASIIVTTSPDLMREVSNVIATLDSNPAMVQHVYSWELKNSDPLAAQAALTALFSGPNTKATPTSTSTSALQQRATTAAQQQTQSTTGFGSSGSSTGSALH